MLRLFVACAPSAASRAQLAAEGARLLRAAPALRVVAAADLHWTLAFLGATPEERVAPLAAALEAVARAQRPFEVRIEGLGAFPSYQRPRVVWAGLEAGPGASAMAGLAKRVRRACLAAGCAPDATGTFEPHVTLGRLGTRGRGSGGPPPEALEKLLTAGTLQGTYIPESLSDLLLMVSEATSLSDMNWDRSQDRDAGGLSPAAPSVGGLHGPGAAGAGHPEGPRIAGAARVPGTGGAAGAPEGDPKADAAPPPEALGTPVRGSPDRSASDRGGADRGARYRVLAAWPFGADTEGSANRATP